MRIFLKENKKWCCVQNYLDVLSDSLRYTPSYTPKLSLKTYNFRLTNLTNINTYNLLPKLNGSNVN